MVSENKEFVIKEAKRVLDKGGLLIIIDFSPDAPLDVGAEKTSPEMIKGIVEKGDFTLKEELQIGLYHFGLIYEKI